MDLMFSSDMSERKMMNMKELFHAFSQLKNEHI